MKKVISTVILFVIMFAFIEERILCSWFEVKHNEHARVFTHEVVRKFLPPQFS